MVLAWKQDYSINVEVLDKQHRQLAELVNQLHTALHPMQSRKEIRGILSTLIDFTRHHFDTEEDLMREYAFPDYPAHQAAHKLVLSQMTTLAASVGDETEIAFDPDADISEDWVTKHLIERDAPLGQFLNDKGVF